MKRTIIFLIISILAIGCSSSGGKNPGTPPTPVPEPDGINFVIKADSKETEIVKSLFVEVKNQGGLTSVEIKDSDKPGFLNVWVDGSDKQLNVASKVFSLIIGLQQLSDAQLLPETTEPQVDVSEIRNIADQVFKAYLKALEAIKLIAIVSEDEDFIKLVGDVEEVGNKIILVVYAVLTALDPSLEEGA